MFFFFQEAFLKSESYELVATWIKCIKIKISFLGVPKQSYFFEKLKISQVKTREARFLTLFYIPIKQTGKLNDC